MNKKILLIDDEENFGKMVKINLEEHGGYEVDAVTNASAGYEKIKENQYDVIFLDVLMPKIEGHEALVEIKKMCNSPVVIISAYVAPPMRKSIIESGAFTCLEKPVKMEQLLQTLEEIEKQAK